ncbi:hypothetical protein [Actinoplanes sp. NPDC051411]|uniref:hypothetical protein n=1 Tax=Actinoplanes sp. NPDC051411 TaxID=3155522 RepID=UPI00344645E5
MVTFPPVALPACEPGFRPGRLDDQIHRWVASEPMKALVAAYGESLPDAGVGDLLAWLDAFSGVHWDFRRHGRVERDQVTAPAFDAGRTELIVAAATALRLVEAAPPPHSEYDHMLVLGGLGRACLQRSRYAAELALSGAVKVGEVAALGSFRPLTHAERELPGLGGAAFEVDAMDVGVRAGFDLTRPVEREGLEGEWDVRTYRWPGQPEIHVLAAPSSEPAIRRANTADTYEFWAGRMRLRATDRILVVTTPIYVPFQHGDAIRILGLRHGCGIDTIGVDPSRVTVPFAPGATNPDRYLQEMRSAIVSMRALHQALP